MNGADDADASLKDFYRYKNSFDKNHTWVTIPKRLSFVVNADPYADVDPSVGDSLEDERPEILAPSYAQLAAISADSDLHRSTGLRPNGLEALSAAATSDRYNQLPPVASTSPILRRSSAGTDGASMSAPPAPSRSSIASPSMNSLRSSHHLNFILNPSNTSSNNFNASIDPSLDRSVSVSHVNLLSDADAETDHETAFLLRHFSEGPGQWMDLFDLGGFFAYYVPVKAIANPLLKHAAAAYAAKQLSRVKGRKAVMGGPCSIQARTERWSEPQKVDWENKGLEHYDKAIELLKEAMSDDGTRDQKLDADTEAAWAASTGHYIDTSSLTPADKRSQSMQDSSSPHSYRASSSTPSMGVERYKRRKISTGKTSSDEMAAATAILCVYEFLNESLGGWKIQLDGTKSLLDIAETNMVPLQAPHVMPRPQLSKARRATFWNFARQDFLSALITESQTRLDPSDLPMWKDAGILIDEDGLVCASNTNASGYPEGHDVMKEDMISNALIWILDKIVNYCVAADTAPSTIAGTPKPWEGINQMTLHQKWLELQKQLTVWYDGLPDTFKPCVEVNPGHGDGEYSVFSEVWFSIPMCACTMQWYHYAQMLLLINQPQHSTIGKTTFHRRFGSYKSITAEIEYHARMICNIGVSRPDASVRVHMIQPLYLAGQCLESDAERMEILRLLRAIEHDTGWATDYRIKQLLELWNYPSM